MHIEEQNILFKEPIEQCSDLTKVLYPKPIKDTDSKEALNFGFILIDILL
jgi:hypothetical protein